MELHDKIVARVEEYARVAATSTGAEVAALFTADATVEDPVGTPVHVGTEAIAAFYESVRGEGRAIEVLTLRVAGNTAAFHFRVTSPLPDATVVVDPIDVMTFDDEARITSMRAIWSESDMSIT